MSRARSYLKKYFYQAAFAIVFLPPMREQEDWKTSALGMSLSKERLVEVSASSTSSAKAQKEKEAAPTFPRFSFNGVDTIAFVLARSGKSEWQAPVPPIEENFTWVSGAWSGLSLSKKELHHFYFHRLPRGMEPKYKVYALGADWDTLDMQRCSDREMYILQRKLGTERYRLIRVDLEPSQELQREKLWTFDLDANEELLKLTPTDCKNLQLDGWPKSFKISLE